jgi:hypothetical protein
MARQAQQHRVDAADCLPGGGRVVLRNVTDEIVVLAGGVAEDADLTRGDRNQPEDHLHQRCLARAVGSDDGHDAARWNVEGALRPDRPSVSDRAGVAKRQRDLPG